VTSPQVDAAVVATVEAQSAARSTLVAQMEALAANAVRHFSGWYDHAAITVWSAQVAARLEAMQARMASQTDAYLTRLVSQLNGPVRPVGRVSVSGLRVGVTHAGAVARATDTYRYQQSRIDSIAPKILSDPASAEPLLSIVSPLDAAVQRAQSVASMDGQLAFRAQSTANMSALPDISGYRRVIHPELSKGGTCGLCIAASDRLYGKHELLPLHDHCECTTLPVIAGQDPGSALNRADLTAAYRLAGGTGRQKLKAVRFRIDQHGELGPVLTAHKDAFRSPSDAKASARPARPSVDPRAQLQRIRDMQARALPKARELAASDPKKWGRYLNQLEVRVKDLDTQLAA